MDSGNSVGAFLIALGGTLAAAAAYDGFRKGFKQRSVILPLVVGLAVGSLGVAPSLITTLFGDAFFSRLAAISSNPNVWLAGVLCLLVYSGASALVLSRDRDQWKRVVEESIHPTLLAIERLVMPRVLTEDQQSTVIAEIKRHPPPACDIKVEVPKGDNEAGYFGHQIASVLNDAGWPAQLVQLDTPTDEGLAIHARYTNATMQAHQNPTKPAPDRIIRAAFEKIRLTFDGGGSGGGQSVQTDEVRMTVGRRRRDTHVGWMPVQPVR